MQSPLSPFDLIKKQHYTEALARLQELPINEDSSTLKALVYLGMKDYQNAKNTLLDLYRSESKNPYVVLLLAKTYKELQDAPKAAYYYKKAMKSQKTRLEAEREYKKLDIREDEIDEKTEKIINIKPFKPTLTFKDVAGMEKEKKYLTNNVLLALQYPEKFKEYGKKLGMAVLFYGGPGGGKTFIASALAGEAKAYFIIARLTDLVSEYVGNTERNIHTLFKEARLNSPCLIFIDEFDAISTKRSMTGGSDAHGGNTFLKLAVATLLVELEGIEKTADPIFVAVASNRPYDIDPALLRSGRLANSLYIRPPDYKQRIAAFRYHLSKKKTARYISHERLSRAAMGYSQADIAEVCDRLAGKQVVKDIATGSQQPITTRLLLREIQNMKNTIDPWYSDTISELVGRTKVETVNGKKYKTKTEGALDAQGKQQYKAMIRDLNQQKSSLYRLHKRITRFVAFTLW